MLEYNELPLFHKYVDTLVIGQIAHVTYRRMKQFQFWYAFHTFRWPTDLVSYGQVEATDWILYFVTCLTFMNRK